MATSGQDGASGAGAHAQAEAVGLGPTTVVRLEGALAQEALRLLHSHTGICAEGGAGYTVGTGRCSTGCIEAMIGRNRRPAGHEQHCVGYTGMRKRPSTQASSKIRESAGHGQTSVVFGGVCHRIRPKPPMVDQRGHPCQATRRATQIFLSRNDKILTPSGLL